jgi:hypothetical protein
MCEDKNITVHGFLLKNGHLTFNRWLPPFLFDQWLEIVNSTYNFNYKTKDDWVSWRWGGKNKYTTKSVYEHLTEHDQGYNFKHIWKSKIPYKIKIFTWLLERNAILTKDNMIRRKWTGDPSCVFCNGIETVDHLIFQCAIARCVWGVVAFFFGTNCVPRNVQQYKNWIQSLLPEAKEIHHFGFAAICWVAWKCRNKAIFDKR